MCMTLRCFFGVVMLGVALLCSRPCYSEDPFEPVPTPADADDGVGSERVLMPPKTDAPITEWVIFLQEVYGNYEVALNSGRYTGVQCDLQLPLRTQCSSCAGRIGCKVVFVEDYEAGLGAALNYLGSGYEACGVIVVHRMPHSDTERDMTLRLEAAVALLRQAKIPITLQHFAATPFRPSDATIDTPVPVRQGAPEVLKGVGSTAISLLH